MELAFHVRLFECADNFNVVVFKQSGAGVHGDGGERGAAAAEQELCLRDYLHDCRLYSVLDSRQSGL